MSSGVESLFSFITEFEALHSSVIASSWIPILLLEFFWKVEVFDWSLRAESKCSQIPQLGALVYSNSRSTIVSTFVHSKTKAAVFDNVGAFSRWFDVVLESWIDEHRSAVFHQESPAMWFPVNVEVGVSYHWELRLLFWHRARQYWGWERWFWPLSQNALCAEPYSCVREIDKDISTLLFMSRYFR